MHQIVDLEDEPVAAKRRFRFTYASVTATIALIVSLSGGAYALSITGRDVVNDSLSGKDIKEKTLKAVPNAKKLGGVKGKEFVRRCGRGTVTAGGWVLGPGFSYDLSMYGPTFQEASGSFWGCKPVQEVLIRRDSAGKYLVAFHPDRRNTLFAIGNVDNTYGGHDDAFISIGTATNTAEGTAYSVEIRNAAGTAVDTPFNIYVY